VKNKLVAILQELTEIVKLFFGPNCEQPKTKSVRERQEGKFRSPLYRCHYCKGTGWVHGSSGLEEYLPSKFGNWGGADSIPYSACPVCKGTGHIETSRTDNNY